MQTLKVPCAGILSVKGIPLQCVFGPWDSSASATNQACFASAAVAVGPWNSFEPSICNMYVYM